MDDSFRQAEASYVALKGQAVAGQISREQFEAALKGLILQDAQGNFWTIGADSGNWYVYDGKSWVKGQPSRGGVGPVAFEPVTMVAPQQPVQQPRGRLLLVLGLSLLAVILSVMLGAIVISNIDQLGALTRPPTATATPLVAVLVPTATTILPTATAPAPTATAPRVAVPVPTATAPAPTPTATRVVPAIGGLWGSNFGKVTLDLGQACGAGPVPVTGFWVQADGKTGVIRNGTLDPASRALEFAYYQSWNDMTGSAKLALSADSKSLTGTWKQSNGQGDWTMTR